MVLSLAAGAVVGVLILGQSPGVSNGYPLDDAWIHMVYGRSLATEGILAYNPGEAAAGSTAPLWTLLVGLVHLALSRISVTAVVVGVMTLGVVAHLLTVWLAMDLTTHITGRRWPAAVTGAVLALSAPLIVGAFSGMEVALCAALILAGVRSCQRGQWRLAGLWLALAPALRPEAACVTVICFAAAFLRLSRQEDKSVVHHLVELAAPSLVMAGIIAGHHMLASGRPLPSTFYFKQQFELAVLPRRLTVAFTHLLAQVPPFWGFAAWLGVTGFLQSRDAARSLIPLLAGLGFVAAVVLLIEPTDTGAFYHLRYYLPAVPLLTVATVAGADYWGNRLSVRWRWTPAAVMLIVGMVGTFATFGPVSRRYHNDVRNINEVQVAMGRWLADHTAPGSWIAASDAGAVRYFSNRPVVDVMGLNTPDLYWDQEHYVATHRVDALALMLAWIRPRQPEKLLVYTVMKTEGYTVSSRQAMSEQYILGCPGDGESVQLEFGGMRRFTVLCRPGGIHMP